MFTVPNVDAMLTDSMTLQQAADAVANLYCVKPLAFAVRPVVTGAVMSAILWLPFGIAGIAGGVLTILPFTWIKFRRFTRSRKAVEAEVLVQILESLEGLDVHQEAAETIAGVWLNHARRGLTFDLDMQVRLYDAVNSPVNIARRKAEAAELHNG